jgi:hypothetical protein
MKKVMLGLAVAAALGAPSARPDLGEVVQSFPAPYSYARALAASDKILYALCEGRIYRLNSANGSVISSYNAYVPGGYARGIGYEYGGYLWLGGHIYYYQGWVGRCDEATGSIYSSFTTYETAVEGGVAFEGDPTRAGPWEIVIIADNAPHGKQSITRHYTAGPLISRFYYSRYQQFACDPAWDYRNELIWVADAERPGHVFGYTKKGSLITSFRSPAAGNHQTHGSTYVGGYLWISTGYNTGIIYKVHCPSGIHAVAPTSLGRVKALFR